MRDYFKDALYAALVLLVLTVTGLVGVGAYQVYRIETRLERWESVVGSHLNDRDTQVKALIMAVHRLVTSTKADAAISTKATEQAIRELTDLIRTIRTETLPEVHETLQEAQGLVKATAEDLNRLSGSANASMLALKDDLERVGTLVETLDRQIKDGSPLVEQTATQIGKVLTDVDALLASEDVKGTLSNVRVTTGHLASSAESVDIALKPLREKVRLLKVILMKVIGIMKIDPISHF